MEIQEELVMSHLHGRNMNNSLALQNLVINPLRVLMREGQPSICR